ncbi:MAG: hypothetical protein MUO67_03980 [Anaerolineales bacterium]|nr:hypothetical protein [Anaerolineales bacterium]
MYYLAMAFPGLRRFRIPLTRDQVLLLLAAFNEIMLGAETYIAHLISGTIVPYEWIPIIFGPAAGVLLLVAGLIAQKKRPLATVIASLVFISSIVVGVMGAFFHLRRALLPTAPIGELVSVPLLVWAPPILGPFTFALVGLVGLSAAWKEDPPDSGILALLKGKRLSLPLSKTRALLFMVGLGGLATVISSVLDHARTDFSNPWLWVPTAVGVFATVVAVGLGAIDMPNRGDVLTYVFAMLLMILVGVIGLGLHVREDLTSQGVVVAERFLRGAPFLAPLLFADMGVLGLAVLLDPAEKKIDNT